MAIKCGLDNDTREDGGICTNKNQVRPARDLKEKEEILSNREESVKNNARHIESASLTEDIE